MSGVAELHHFNADPDPSLHFTADPDPFFQYNAIRIRFFT
jgi:hypothetical protein